jgi:hypothetical protein
MIDFRLKLKKNYWHNLGKNIALSQNNELRYYNKKFKINEDICIFVGTRLLQR